MVFAPKAHLFLGGMACLGMAQAQTQFNRGLSMDNCAEDDFTHIVGHGSEGGGSEFCAGKWKEGILIKRIEFQGADDIIQGMTVTFDDNKYETFGLMEGPEDRYGKIEIDSSADTITKLELWDGGNNHDDGYAISKVLLSASNDQHLEVEQEDMDDDIEPMRADVGNSGMLLGIRGRAGLGVDRLEFIFAKEKVKKRSIENMKLDPDVDELNLRESNEERGFIVEYLDEIHHVNMLNTSTEVWLRGEQKLTTSTSITKTTSDTFHLGMGFEFKAKFGLPLAETELTTSTDMFWETTNSQASTETETEEVTKAWQQIATAEPLQALRCYAWTFAATTVDVSWEGDVRIEFEDGTALEYPSHGEYNTAQYTRVNTFCEPESIEEAEDASRSGKKVYQNGERLSQRDIGNWSRAKAARRGLGGPVA